MRLKSGVSLLGVRQETSIAMMIADSVYKENLRIGITVTSVTDGRHSRTSLHYTGCAFDIRTRANDGDQWTRDKKNAIAIQLREALGIDFDVVVERTHIHIEFQPKR